MADEPSWLDLKHAFQNIEDDRWHPLRAEHISAQHVSVEWPFDAGRSPVPGVLADAAHWRIVGGGKNTAQQFVPIATLAARKLGHSDVEWWRWLDVLRESATDVQSDDEPLVIARPELTPSPSPTEHAEDAPLPPLTRLSADVIRRQAREASDAIVDAVAIDTIYLLAASTNEAARRAVATIASQSVEPVDNRPILAVNLDRLRMRCGLSRTALADKVGIDKRLCFEHLDGTRTPNSDMVLRYTDLFAELGHVFFADVITLRAID